MSELVENDTSFTLLSYHEPEIFHFMFSSDCGGDHFESRSLAELAVTFESYIGAKFSLKWFGLSNQSRKKGRKRMVTESTKMTLLINDEARLHDDHNSHVVTLCLENVDFVTLSRHRHVALI